VFLKLCFYFFLYLTPPPPPRPRPSPPPPPGGGGGGEINSACGPGAGGAYIFLLGEKNQKFLLIPPGSASVEPDLYTLNEFITTP